MTEHIYAHDHPESDRARGGGFTLWFTGLSGSGKSTIAHLVGPAAGRARAHRRVPRRRHRPHAPLEGPRLLEGRPRHEHRAHRLGRLAHHPARGHGHHRRHLPVRRDAPEGARAGGAVRAVRGGVRQGIRRGVRAPRRQRPLRQGVRRRDQGLHRRRRSVRGAGEPRGRRRHGDADPGGERADRRPAARGARARRRRGIAHEHRHDRPSDPAARRRARRAVGRPP